MYISLCFLLLLTLYNSSQSIITLVYYHNNYSGIIEIKLALFWLSTAISSLFAPYYCR